MPLSRVLFTSLLALSLLPNGGAARDLFVNNRAGDDTFDGSRAAITQVGGPVRTISRALDLAMVGDRIVIAKTDTPYREQITLGGPRLHGTATRPLVIESDGAVLDGTVRACEGAWRQLEGNVFALQPRRLAYQQLFRNGAPLERVHPVSAANLEDALEPMQWTLTRGALLLRTEKDRLPRYYELRHGGLQTGVTLYNARHVVVRGLVIQGFQQDGVNAHDLTRDCVIERCEIRANGRSGVSAGGAGRLTVRGSNLYDNGVSQARVEGHARLTIDSCDIEAPATAVEFDNRGGRLLVDGEAR